MARLKESEKSTMKLRLVEAPHKRSIAEQEMRYDLILGDKLVGEAYFNTRGYNVIKRPGELQGFIAGEHSLPALRKEVTYWNKINAKPDRMENPRKARGMRKRNKTIIKADRIEHLDVARVHNPRYLVSRDGEEVGIFPGYNALMAVNAARKIYGPGKYTSTKTGEAMYLGRGALETERREREERTARAAAKAAAKRDKIQLPKKSRTRRNPAEKDAEHPIEVSRHFRGGPPGHLSPWQKAMAIGQAELFDTGIKLAPRAAELRAARLSNPGATKPVYQSGLKQATAGQLPRLARVGLRVGRTPAEIRSDLATTGRFSAEQIRRAIDQATTAERRSNPKKRGRRNPASSWAEQVAESKRNFKRELKKNVAKANKLYALLLEYYASFGPEGAQRGAQIYIEDWLRKGLDGLKGQAFSEGLDYHIEKLEQSLEARRENPPVREIFEAFNGRPATRATTVEAPRRTPARVAQLGRLRLIRTADGRTWRFPGERAPFLAADSKGKLHVVGGQYRANPAGEECGEIEQIEYQTSKPHLGHDNETIYYHQLGEETGERPTLEITPEGELQIIGGNYRIEADGIHN